jgi:hypothetical protein
MISLLNNDEIFKILAYNIIERLKENNLKNVIILNKYCQIFLKKNSKSNKNSIKTCKFIL